MTAICLRCRQRMNGSSCGSEAEYTLPSGVVAPRIPYGKERGWLEYGDYIPAQCHDCGVKLGGFHHAYCDVEECGICHVQALQCVHHLAK